MTIDVALNAYNGPLDLLLDLIKENKIDIYDIPIAEITDQYLTCLEKMEQMNLTVAGDFLVMAATLLYIKSRMLLPQDIQEEEDDEDIDPRTDLVNKLLEYQAFKEAAKDLNMLQNERKMSFKRGVSDGHTFEIETVSSDLGIPSSIYELIQAFSNVLKINSIETFHEIHEEEVSIEEKVNFITEVLLKEREVLFSRLFNERSTKNELIATFLALLEMIKLKKIQIVQSEIFGEIMIQSKQKVSE